MMRCALNSHKAFSLILLLLTLSFFVNGQSEPLDSGDLQVILNIIDSFPSIARDLNWTGPVNESNACDLRGVNCSLSLNPRRIIRLNLSEIKESGFLPDSMSNLIEVTELQIVGQSFTQELPSFVNLTKLERLVLIQYAPPLVQSLDIFPNSLVNLQMTNFNLSGVDLSPLGALANLSNLWLQYCQMTGAMPSFATNKLLQSIDMGGGFLTALPADTSLQTLANLVHFKVSSNKIAGELPQYFGSMKALVGLYLDDNNFSGDIPDLTKLNNLTQLNLNDNNFTGNVFDALGVLPSLTFCNVSNNNVELECPATQAVCCHKSTSTTSTEPTTADITTATSGAITTVAPTITTATSTATTDEICTHEYQCICSSDLTAIISSPTVCNAGIWIISGDATNNKTVIVAQGDKVIIGGSFVQTSQGTLRIYANATQTGSIQADNVELGGTLVIIVTSKTQGEQNITIINATSISGTFDNITIVQQYEGSNCLRTKIRPTYTETTLSVLVTQTKKSNCGNKGRTIGIAVGVSVGAALIIAIVIVVVLVVYKKVKGPEPIKPAHHNQQAII